MRARPIETAPRVEEFLAENQHGDWIRVTRYNNPHKIENTVISARLGRWWKASRWMPLPAPPAVAKEGT